MGRDETEVVILDFDGTVLNSMGFLIEKATRLLTENYGLIEEEARSAYIRTTGNPFSVQIEMLFPGHPLNKKVVAQFERAKRENLFSFELFPEVPQAISIMRQNGLKVSISSGNYRNLITRFLSVRRLEVDLVMGYKKGFTKGKDHFDFARKFFECDFDRMVFVGDSRHDGEVAGAVGVRFIARSGLYSKQQLERDLPGIPVVDSLIEVLPILGIAFKGSPVG
ncbi:MAG: HAD family hydrolase [bacterium]